MSKPVRVVLVGIAILTALTSMAYGADLFKIFSNSFTIKSPREVLTYANNSGTTKQLTFRLTYEGGRTSIIAFSSAMSSQVSKTKNKVAVGVVAIPDGQMKVIELSSPESAGRAKLEMWLNP